MLFLAVLAVALVTLRPAGGRFSVLAEVTIQAPWLVVAALLLQIVTISVLVDPPHLLAASLHVLSYAVAGAFLWRNRRLAGLPLLTAGAALNLTAILANGGVMPARAPALRSSGIPVDPDHFLNSTTLARPHLGLLGDVFAVPAQAGLFANVFSLGDLLLAAGALVLLHAAAGCPWAVAAAYSRTSAGPECTGSPAASHASTPPSRSVPRRRPTARNDAAARLEL